MGLKCPLNFTVYSQLSLFLFLLSYDPLLLLRVGPIILLLIMTFYPFGSQNCCTIQTTTDTKDILINAHNDELVSVLSYGCLLISHIPFLILPTWA